jgi:hypothetical protein
MTSHAHEDFLAGVQGDGGHIGPEHWLLRHKLEQE